MSHAAHRLIDVGIVPSASGSRSVPKRQRQITPNKADIRIAIDEMLNRAGLTRRDIAARLGCSAAAISNHANGNTTSAPGNGKTYRYERKPSIEWFARVAAICGCQLIVRYSEINEKDTI